MATWLMLFTIGLPWLGALGVWVRGDKHPRDQHRLATLFSLVAGMASLMLLFHTSDEAEVHIAMGTVFGDFTLVPDGLGVFLATVATVIGSLTIIFSIDYMHGEEQLGRYYALMLLFIGAMAGLVLSGSMLFMFLFWEITAFCSYALISFHNDDPKAVAGGIKALIITSLGGVGLLAGALAIFAHLGSYQNSDFLAQAHTLPDGVLAAIGFGFLAAAAAKSAQIPFQTWLPDAMEAPTPVSALIHAATMVNAGVYLLARFYPAFEGVSGWTTAVITCGLLSALLAAIMALVATDIKRVLAYSTISQLGYMFYAIGTGAIFASQFHLLSHAVFKALLFLGAGAVIHAVGTRDMRQMGDLKRQMPFTRTVFVIGALALVGLPIANGFFSKELILEDGLDHGPAWAYAGMLIGVGLTALYTMRMVMMVFYGSPKVKTHGHDAPTAMRVSLAVLALGTLTTWVLAGGFGDLLAENLPLHHLEVEETTEIIEEIVTATPTWAALLVVAAGLSAWLLHDSLPRLIDLAKPFTHFAGGGLGFEWLNRRIIDLTQSTALILRRTQTGQFNWNAAGIAGALIVVLAVLALGG